MGKLIINDQSANMYIKGRYKGDNSWLILVIFGYCTDNDKDWFSLFLDFEKVLTAKNGTIYTELEKFIQVDENVIQNSNIKVKILNGFQEHVGGCTTLAILFKYSMMTFWRKRFIIMLHGFQTRGPKVFYRSPVNRQQTVQSVKDNQNDRIQMNAHFIGNTSIWCFELLVWRRISSKEKTLLYLFLPCPGSTPWNIWPKPLPEWQHSKAFCLWSSLWLLLTMPWIHPRPVGWIWF